MVLGISTIEEDLTRELIVVCSDDVVAEYEALDESCSTAGDSPSDCADQR